MKYNELNEKCKDCVHMKPWSLDMSGNHACMCKEHQLEYFNKRAEDCSKYTHVEEIELIEVGEIFKRFAMCYQKHRTKDCEYCNCDKCVLNVTDEEFELMMKHIKKTIGLNIVRGACMTIGEIESNPILNALDIIECRLNSTDVECNHCIDKQNCDWVKSMEIIKNFVISSCATADATKSKNLNNLKR